MSRVLGVEYVCWVSCCAKQPNGSPKRALKYSFPVLMFARMLMGRHEKIFLKQLIERFKGGDNINKGNTARKKVLITVTLIIDKLEEIAIHKTGDWHAWI